METKYIVLIIGGTIILSILVVLIIAFIFIYQKRYYKYLKEKQEMHVQFAHTLMQSQLEIHDQTLQNISYEIHDNIGQVASLIKINLNTLKLDNVEKATEKINDTKDLVRQLITDVKSLSASLGTDRIAKIGLIRAIEIEVERLNKTGDFITKIIKEDDLPLLNNEKAILLYRMVQEILNNIVKHAQAKHITILITNTDDRFILAIKDNGIGFDVDEKLNTKDGAGLSNLKNRAKLVNAFIAIESKPDKGTKITIEMPI